MIAFGCPSRPAGVGKVWIRWKFVSSRCFIDLFWGSVTLSTKMHRHYNDCVHRKRQHTCGNNTIPYKLASLVTFESLKSQVATGLSRAGRFGR